RIQILDLGFRAEFSLSGSAHRYVRVAAKTALFHVAVVDLEPDEDRPQPAEKLCGVRRRHDVRFGNDLDQRNATSVEVEVGSAARIGKPFVQRLSGVFFQMDATDSDAPLNAAARVLDRATGCERLLVLG